MASPFPIELNSEDGNCIVWVSGEVELSVSEQLVDMGKLAALQSPSPVGVVIDLGNLTFIDSTGLGVLVRIRASAHEAGKTFSLRNVPQPTGRLLKLTGLDVLMRSD